MTRGPVLFAAAMLCGACLGGCSDGEDGGGERPRPRVEEVQEARVPTTARPLPPRAPRVGTARPAPAPTATDSAAAAAEDVSPEWKMNQRKMGPYR
ncbi:MAG TPA: hypothetical protein VGB66_17650, partial [Longimicrobium sp.]